MMANSTADAGTPDGRAQILKTYGVHPEALAKAPARVVAILNGLSSQLKRQQTKGSDYFVGNTLTAADVYWACFSILLEPLAPGCARCTLKSRRKSPPRSIRSCCATAISSSASISVCRWTIEFNAGSSTAPV
jgi:hypothetical protein